MRKILTVALLIVAPMVSGGCDSINSTTDAIVQDQTPTPQTDRKEACEYFRNDLCKAIEDCGKFTLYGFADTAACKTFFDENISNCGGCDKTQPDMLTLVLEGQLDTCLADTGAASGTTCTELFPDAETLNVPASCETYGTAAGATTCI